MENVVVSHAGSVAFRDGEYVRTAGTTNWKVWPIAAFEPPIRVPVGQIRIDFASPVKSPYMVVVTAHRIANAPLMAANYGDVDENGFVVHLWETVADRTLQNGDFSFAVYQVTEK
jgi:hypothetical protein